MIQEHPIKARMRKYGIRLWEVRFKTGISEAVLSRHLSGIQEMDSEREKLVCKAVEDIIQEQES